MTPGLYLVGFCLFSLACLLWREEAVTRAEAQSVKWWWLAVLVAFAIIALR